MANQRNLKAFVRFDGSGRIVAGSLILRKNKPKVGRWQEIPAYECCNDVPTVLTDTIPGTFPVQYPCVSIVCDETTVATACTNVASVANITALVQLFNDNEETRAFGTYTAVNATTVQLVVPLSVKNALCPNGVLSFNIFED
jgi:hypothetical protein